MQNYPIHKPFALSYIGPREDLYIWGLHWGWIEDAARDKKQSTNSRINKLLGSLEARRRVAQWEIHTTAGFIVDPRKTKAKIFAVRKLILWSRSELWEVSMNELLARLREIEVSFR